MQLVDENTVLEIGKFYNVRCALMIRQKNDVHYYMPVIGVAHEDTFAALGKHYHIDGRFVGKEGELVNFKDGFTNQVCECVPHKTDPYRMFVGQIVIRRRKCKRLITGVNPPKEAFKYGKYAEWYNSMIGKSCKGKKCPHYGTTMQERGGKLICPLHNLIGCPTTEKIIPY